MQITSWDGSIHLACDSRCTPPGTTEIVSEASVIKNRCLSVPSAVCLRRGSPQRKYDQDLSDSGAHLRY